MSTQLPPEGISQSAWDEAEAVGEAIHGRHERGWVAWPLITEAGPSPREIVARAIDAATERERKRWSGVIDALRNKAASQQRSQGPLANRMMEAEKRERAIALDRDQWKARATQAEARLHSLGVNDNFARLVVTGEIS